MILTGRVRDRSTGQGIPKITVVYAVEGDGWYAPSGELLIEPEVDLSRQTDEDGRFRLVLRPGRGTLRLENIPHTFSQPRATFFNPVDPGFSAKVDGRAGQTIDVADFQLEHAPIMPVLVLDPDGQPIANARIDLPEDNFLDEKNRPAVFTDARGRCDVVILKPHDRTVLDITAPDRLLGTVFTILKGQAQADHERPLNIRLKPLCSASGRVFDQDSHPIPEATTRIYRFVDFDGSGGGFWRPDGLHKVDQDGSFLIERLIPGAHYKVEVQAKGHVSPHVIGFTIDRPGARARIDDYHLRIADQEVRGVVVNPQGQPVAGAYVHFTDELADLPGFGPDDGFGPDWSDHTDANGRFHLTHLPRGPIKLWVASHAPGEGLGDPTDTTFEVPPGQTDVRIVLPDVR